MVKKIIFVLMFLFPISVFSLSKLYPNAEVCFKMDYKYEHTRLGNSNFYFYKVADIKQNGEYKVNSKFAKYNLDINSDNLKNYKDTIKFFVNRDNIEPDYVKRTDSNGEFFTCEFSQGIYLIVGEKNILDDYTYISDDYLMSIPYYNKIENDWDYNLIFTPKVNRYINEITDELISKTVLVAWNDNNNKSLKRPLGISVMLIKNSEEIDTVILNEDNNWRYTWEGLPKNDEYGIVVSYDVYEDDIADYKIKLDNIDDVVSILNTYLNPQIEPSEEDEPEKEKEKDIEKEEPEKENEEILPETGLLWWPVPILFLCGLIFVIRGIKLYNEKK